MPSPTHESLVDLFRECPALAPELLRGAGLGLPIVRAIAEAHGGRAWLQDRPRGGTVAVLEIPKKAKLKAVS